jgi:hypothetical protein
LPAGHGATSAYLHERPDASSWLEAVALAHRGQAGEQRVDDHQPVVGAELT